jgi:16S rRNA C967 or C1407 C5-methylase (RsmB/RsmF family)
VNNTTSPFELYYAAIYGERWESLKHALLNPTEKANRPCFDGFAEYRMDQASIEAALALHVKPGDQVLDLCAAPGGKTLVLAEKIGEKGSLVANELSLARRMRLKEVIETHAPSSVQKQIHITGFDGNQFGLKRKAAFDRVLLDAPCSSEQHLLEDDPEQKDWKESRTKQLAMRQYSLLCSALLTLKPGGTMVYSTCSISPLENDGVVGRLLSKKSGEVIIDPDTNDLSHFEKTEFGFQIFPDLFAGIGPIYFSRLKKTI